MEAAMAQLSDVEFRVASSVEDIIRDSAVTRPTWYFYFNNISSYYEEVFRVSSDIINDLMMNDFHSISSFRQYIQVITERRHELFLCNLHTIALVIPQLRRQWKEMYCEFIKRHTESAIMLFNLIPSDAEVFSRNLINQIVINPKPYLSDDNELRQLVLSKYKLVAKVLVDQRSVA